ncbi:hypothetical protein EVA_02462 [gut metagenome]|uniref:Uncharacterized protein n=1 Tax=gut metagenome TaxID=749906 RepID=J9H128_9ZZZZ
MFGIMRRYFQKLIDLSNKSTLWHFNLNICPRKNK